LAKRQKEKEGRQTEIGYNGLQRESISQFGIQNPGSKKAVTRCQRQERFSCRSWKKNLLSHASPVLAYRRKRKREGRKMIERGMKE
jgi:hypothetical protein